MEKKLRFGDLVRNSGRPEIVTLWRDPDQDPSFSRAIKENRVLTITQEHGKKDFGRVGFERKPGALYLVFPRALPGETEARVVGINYDLAEQPVTRPATQVIEESKPAHVRKKIEPVQPTPESPLREAAQLPPPEPVKAPLPLPKPVKRKYTVRVRRTAVIEQNMTLRATNETEAERLALELMSKKPLKAPGASVQNEIVR